MSISTSLRRADWGLPLIKNYEYKDGFKSFALVVAVYLAIQIVLSFALVNVDAGSVWYWVILAISSLSIGATAYAYAFLRKADFVSVTRIGRAPKIIHIIWGLVATVGLIHFMIPLNGWISDLIEKIGLKRPEVDLPMQIVPLILVASVLPSFTEEIMFRGTIGNALTSGNGDWRKGVLISGALFSLFHMNPAQTLHQFVLGCFLTVLAYRSGSLWTSVIVHLFNNLVAVILAVFVEESGFYEKNAVWLCIAGAIVFILSLWGYFATTKSYANTASCDESDESQVGNGKLENNALVTFIFAVVVCAAMWIANLFV
ncbi:MAG: CPBP family intramembrane metalloprotease [Corallococcus sp.]|nr:CPBP family intramembrane metalloprotease [Corallococcus sp.]MCM1395774.1 CPBP family intramembrane metalloprotease [Corallococcus sp.]